MTTLVGEYSRGELSKEDRQFAERALQLSLSRIVGFWRQHGNIGVHEYMVGYLEGLKQSPLKPEVQDLIRATMMDIVLSILTEIDSSYVLETHDMPALAFRINDLDCATIKH
ncbi:hypothetical protein [Vibrio phage vB_VmeM-Yong XC32]|nr:hypothetical protein [Vibrio phage vB_VmeM-Yong XC31]QAX96411.1 hypothetical protein [Vibrio phage vB_VmeM-Yong XC32]QAX96728.1 hypothetical protein [Vibrio phage vB_VmeM-Yong MS31]QAX97047.1 hypothetical protein [Vibrio phage vB_VmeM-Yong MS32]